MSVKSKKGKVVMLTTKKSNLLFSGFGTLFKTPPMKPKTSDMYKHLYITSEEEIKEGDIIIAYYGNETDWDSRVWQRINNTYYTLDRKLCSWDKECTTFVKVIATTDISLNLPTIKQSFIDKYIAQYNDGNVIEDVLIEMKQLMVRGNYNNKCSVCGEIFSYSDKLNFICSKCGLCVKTNSSNEVTIRKVKDSWNREEVLELLDFVNERLPDLYSRFSCEEELKEWEDSL